MQLEMEMKLSRKLRERANNRNADEPEIGDRLRDQHSKIATTQLNDSDKEDSDEQTESEKSETGSNISMENHQREPQKKSTGGRLPRKQIVCLPGNFHKRVRETSGNSGPEMNKLTMVYGRL